MVQRKMNMEKIAGKYDPQTGKILNAMGNMRRADILDAYGTFIHELQHVHLNYFTVAGAITEILRVELNVTPETDKKHYEKIKELIEILCEGFQDLQEIYANSMELLWVEEHQGIAQAEKLYERKDEGYKRYSRRFSEITKCCKTLEEKRQIIHRLCVRAARPALEVSQFATLLTDAEGLRGYFEREGNIEKRLEQIVADYKNAASGEDNDYSTSVTEILPLLIRNDILVYSTELIAFSLNVVENMEERDLIELLENHYQDSLIEKTKVFDFRLAAEKMKVVHRKWEKEYFCIIKHHSELLCPEEDYLLLSCSDSGSYIGQEVTKEELGEAITLAKAVVIDFDEFDIRKNRPKYFSLQDTPLFVVLTEYRQCEKWIAEIIEEDLYFVGLYPEDIQNFYTVLYFRRRKEPGIIFVFPTLKCLAKALIEKMGLRDKIMLSQEQKSLKLFAGFADELQMMYVITWILSFVSETRWDGTRMQKASSMLSLGFVRTLLDSALEFRGKGYWAYQSALPTMETVSDGLYALMKFENEENTGVLCSQKYNGIDYPIFFRDRASARHYREQRLDRQELKIVAVDDYYWHMMSGYLQHGCGKWLLCMEEDKGVLFDIGKYKEVLHFLKN